MPQNLNYHDHFWALDQFLREHQHLWRPRPFNHLQLEWENLHPELSQWLRQRSLEQAEAVHNQPETLAAPAPYTQWAQQSAELCQIPKAISLELPTKAEPVAVPGRKWQQIQAFANSLSFRQKPSHWLDWCAGKGHLGRHLTAPDQALTCLEYDPTLVAAGQQLSQRQQLHAQHLCQDVFDQSVQQHLAPEITPVALHACGDLHTHLLKQAQQQHCQQLAIVPCCYNRIHSSHYQPLSSIAQRSNLQLSREDLSLPLSETVTGGTRVRRQRDQSMAWRLGFDALQRELRGLDQYLPTPSLSAEWLSRSFADYCRHLAQLKHLSIDSEPDWAALQAYGHQRLAQVRNLELVRSLFRRPMELWLLMDQALYLQEHGYQVQLKEFCEHALSPRNLLLQAEKQAVDKSVDENLIKP